LLALIWRVSTKFCRAPRTIPLGHIRRAVILMVLLIFARGWTPALPIECSHHHGPKIRQRTLQSSGNRRQHRGPEIEPHVQPSRRRRPRQHRIIFELLPHRAKCRHACNVSKQLILYNVRLKRLQSTVIKTRQKATPSPGPTPHRTADTHTAKSTTTYLPPTKTTTTQDRKRDRHTRQTQLEMGQPTN
jgi:hypothetical protein